MPLADLRPALRGGALAAAVALLGLSAAPAAAVGPGNLLPKLTYPDSKADGTLSTRDASCGLFGCRAPRQD